MDFIFYMIWRYQMVKEFILIMIYLWVSDFLVFVGFIMIMRDLLNTLYCVLSRSLVKYYVVAIQDPNSALCLWIKRFHPDNPQ